MTTETGATVDPGVPSQLTTYVGRASEIAEARRLIAESPVVTLTGPGGVGKTRLAGRLSEFVSPDFAQGVIFAPLAELQDPGLVASTVADLAGLVDQSSRPALEVLTDALRERQSLLVLDNCEHLVEACAALADRIARSCPDVTILCTSRQSLGVDGERILPVGPLSIPEPEEPLARLEEYDAVRLFSERARAVVPDFRLDDENAEDVLRLCHQLDGLPLAIELAAVRLRALSVRQISERLDQRFTLLGRTGRRLVPSRHETLQALMDSSHDLCDRREQLVWERMSVFAGSVGLDAAEAVVSGEGIERHEVLEVIESLLDKSILLRVEEHGEVRYRMLETIRQYGAARLQARGDIDAWRRRHRDFYAELLRRLADDWLGPRQVEWTNRVRRELNDVRRALDFCARSADDAVVGLEMVLHNKEGWLIRGLLTEARLHIERLLKADPADPVVCARALWCLSFLAVVQGDVEAHEQALGEAEAIIEQHPDCVTTGYLLQARAYAALIGDDMEVAAPLFEESSRALQDAGDRAGALWSRYNYGLATALAGDFDLGRSVLRECIAAYTALGETSWRSWALWSLGAAEYLAGDLDQASAACDEVLRQHALLGDRAIIAFALTVTAGVTAHRGEHERSARIFGSATAVWMSLGSSPLRFGTFAPCVDRDTAQVTAGLGEAAAAAEFARGYTMSVEEAVADALGREPVSQVVDDGLTVRQRQVVELVAQGMTNRDIAERLVISLRTAETHVNHILTKLGLTNRVQLAAWASQQAPAEPALAGRGGGGGGGGPQRTWPTSSQRVPLPRR